MGRKLDLIFAILEWLEEQPTTWAAIPKEMAGYSEDVVAYHVTLLKEGGLINADSLDTSGYTRLTWQGHEKLEELRAVVKGFCK